MANINENKLNQVIAKAINEAFMTSSMAYADEYNALEDLFHILMRDLYDTVDMDEDERKIKDKKLRQVIGLVERAMKILENIK